jgi:hypothetical protein
VDHAGLEYRLASPPACRISIFSPPCDIRETSAAKA